MNIEKNCCNLIHSIEKCISGVFSSYAYNEVIYNYGEDTTGFIKEIALKETMEEISPVRIYGSLLNNGEMFSVLCGEKTEKGLAEQVALMINSCLGLGTEKITVKLGGEFISAKPLLEEYGYGKFIDKENLDSNIFEGVFSENKEKVFRGEVFELNRKGFIYSVIKLQPVLDKLITKADPESALLPVTLVASDENSLSFSVALGLRSQGLKVEEYTNKGSMADATEYAELKGITILLWVSGNTVLMKNLKTGERSETTVDKLLSNKN